MRPHRFATAIITAAFFVIANTHAGEAPQAQPAPQPQLVSAPSVLELYTEEMRAAGETGQVRIKACNDAAGKLTTVEVLESSGFERLDQAAVKHVRGYVLKPATVDGVAVGSCFGVPLTFSPPKPPSPAAPRVVAKPGSMVDYYPAQSLKNREQGTVRVRTCFNTQGRVTRVSVDTSSGFQALDAAALKAARQYRFQPGVQDGVPQADCVTMPIRFFLPE